AGQPGAGRLASVDGPFASDTIIFSYDELGRLRERSVNGDANTMSRTFDALGRLGSMTTALGQFAYAYNPTGGLLQTVNLPNGESANYAYYGVNNDLRLNTLQRKLGDTEIFFEKYTYAGNGSLLTRLKRSLGEPGQTLSYTYDDADQLLGVSNPNDTSNYPQSYAYDSAGNLTSSTTPSGNRNFTYNSLNQRVTDAGVAQQFDGNGNLSAGMGFSFSWDAENRLKSVSYNGTQKRIEYDYDGQGRRVRIRSMEGGVKTAEYLYIWDGLQLCEKRDSAVETFPVAIYYPQGEQKFLSGTYLNYFYLGDRLGSVRGATSDTGSIIQNSDYLPYGPPSPQKPAATDPDFGFTGHLKCPFTGLTLAPYRVLGYANWLNRDPIEENGGVNLYGYVANNPVNGVDPLGLWALTDCPEGILDDDWRFTPSEDDIIQANINAIRDLEWTAFWGFASWFRLPALAAETTQGTKVFRVWGDEAGACGRSWTTVDPRTVSNFRKAAGLPTQNSGRFVSEGVLQNTQGVATRGALPLH
ncbi:MAG: RHS repeat-associated core domain-containing protein, partial [Terrimicrobiaceae bacterium]